MPQTVVSCHGLVMPFEAEHQTLRLELGLVMDREPICGHVRDADGVEHAFTGWLELIQLLEHVRVGLQGGRGQSL